MPGTITKRRRENLFQEIFDALRQWPELDRRIFYEAHYRGQSPEVISRSLQLDLEKVSTILQQCDCRLHASLRNFRKSEKQLIIPAEIACPAACMQDLKAARALAAKVSNNLDTSQIPA